MGGSTRVDTRQGSIEIQILVESALAGEVAMTEGLDPGLPNDYAAITAGFIEIGHDGVQLFIFICQVSANFFHRSFSLSGQAGIDY